MKSRTTVIRAVCVVLAAIVSLSVPIAPAFGKTQYETRFVSLMQGSQDGVVIGQVTSKHDIEECENGAPVKIQRMNKDGDWVKVGSGQTNDKGKYSITINPKAGQYRAFAVSFDDKNGPAQADLVCKRAVSEVVTL